MSIETTFDHEGYTITIEHDEHASSPREWDNLGVIVASHPRYDLGDKYSSEPISEAELKRDEDARIILPLYIYDHSGITLSTTPFSCRWDSGQIGWIYATADQIRREFNVKYITKKIEEQVKDVLEGEVSVYSRYLEGEVYRFEITKDGEIIDSCSDYHSELEYVRQEAIHACP